MTSKQVNRVVLREQVREELLERILDGRYRPGERLIETQLAKEFGTSQAPVREALRDLEAFQLVQSEPIRGTRVREFSKEEHAEIYPVRAALEETAAELAASKLAGRVDDLQAELDAMRSAALRGDLREVVHHDAGFHRIIVESSGNSLLIQLWNILGIEMRTTITALAAALDPRDLAEMHQPVLDAIAAGELDETGKRLRRHIEHFGELMVAAETPQAAERGSP
jgi:DNA-binding GntR family transcriptional regulator